MTFSGRNLIHFFQISIVVLSLIAAASAKSIQSGEQIICVFEKSSSIFFFVIEF